MDFTSAKKRLPLSCTIVLVLATVYCLGLLAQVVTAPSPVHMAPEPRSVEVGREYFAAINELMTTGSPMVLRTLLSESFLDHGTGEIGKDPFIAKFTALSTVFEKAEFTVVSIAGSGDLVLAQTRLEFSGYPTFAGITLGTDVELPNDEVLRVEQGRIVERWSSATVQPTFESIATIENAFLAGEPALIWWRLDPVSSTVFSPGGDTILTPLTGELRVRHDESTYEAMHIFRPSLLPVPPMQLPGRAGEITLRPGDVLHVPSFSAVRLRVVGSSPVTLLEIGALPVGEPPQSMRSASSYRLISASNGTVPLVGQLAIGFVELPEGTAFNHVGVPGSYEFALAGRGGIIIEIDTGVVCTRNPYCDQTGSGSARLASGDAAIIVDGSSVTYAPLEGRSSRLYLVTFIPHVSA